MSTKPSSIVRPSLIGALLAIVALGLAAGTALAHAELDTADPADGAVLDTPPTTIRLTFTERLDASKSSFRLLLGDDNLGVGEVAGPRAMTLDGLTLGPGKYLIKWTSASADDGDIERGQLTFKVEEPPASVEPSDSPAPTPEPSGEPTPSPTVSPTENDVITPEPSVTEAPPVTPSPVPPTPAPSAAPTEPAASTSDVLLPIVVGLLL
ncbi:MAG TPA: copper resistance protein CopC, partial [Candidatus Limnocylindrales bacterium]